MGRRKYISKRNFKSQDILTHIAITRLAHKPALFCEILSKLDFDNLTFTDQLLAIQIASIFCRIIDVSVLDQTKHGIDFDVVDKSRNQLVTLINAFNRSKKPDNSQNKALAEILNQLENEGD